MRAFDRSIRRSCQSVSTFIGVVWVLALPTAALAAFVVIENGSAPPDPANVINDDAHISDSVFVRNAGCPPFWPSGSPQADCPAPGPPTDVEIGVNAEIGGHVTTLDGSNLLIRGGTIGGSLLSKDQSQITMQGGSVADDLKSLSASTVYLEGGTIQNDLLAYANSRILVSGSGFAVDGSPVPYGPLVAEVGHLTGTLDSGDPIDNDFVQGGSVYTGDIILSDPDAGVPDVEVNGMDGIVDVLVGENVTFSIAFAANGYLGQPGELYLGIVVPGNIFWLTAGGIEAVPAPLFELPGLVDIPPVDLFTLPAASGFLGILMVVDNAINGAIDAGAWSDFSAYLAP